jgi:hypothetical protein
MIAKRVLLLFASLLFSTDYTGAQTRILASDLEIDVAINTAGQLRLDVDIFVTKPQIDKGAYTGEVLDPKPAFEIRDQLFDQTIIPSSSIELAISRKGSVQLGILVGPSLKSFLAKFKRNDEQYFYMSDSLFVELENDSIVIITPEKLREVSSKERIALSQKETDELIDAKGGYVSVFNNRIDAGFRDAPNDSLDASGYLDFVFAKQFTKIWHGQISGLLSSNLEDNLAHVKISPFNIRLLKEHSVILDTYVQSSLNGREVRLAGSLSYSGLFPNFIDLTQGYNRMRPKPIVGVGFNLSYYSESLATQVEKEIIGETFLDLIYHIPIQDKYQLYLELHAFWRTDENFAFKKKNAEWNWNISIAYNFQGVSKILGKYSYGTDAFTMEADNRLMVGFLIDLIE